MYQWLMGCKAALVCLISVSEKKIRITETRELTLRQGHHVVITSCEKARITKKYPCIAQGYCTQENNSCHHIGFIVRMCVGADEEYKKQWNKCRGKVCCSEDFASKIVTRETSHIIM